MVFTTCENRDPHKAQIAEICQIYQTISLFRIRFLKQNVSDSDSVLGHA